ncbi:TrmB family transcriptional regulator sugar-binding domain-containing protein [Streptomyces sp. TRM49041]|uniref:TrmB family transcriptional regulator sugar-binding domain-containing protein n=1 Tax=Streptomyces sp. TRM49041 TaxID=2603216 RepID=UPI0011EF0651|nr:TrmB family transcriptional regulator sugar-binding domain-containing protein [Streptomyces sp. TRM49041]
MTERDGSVWRAAGVLSVAARGLYARITRGEPVVPEDADALRELVAWHLVIVDPDSPELPIALDPQEAGRRRLDDELRDMAARAARIAAIPDLSDELGLHFERAKWRAGSGSEFLAGREQIAARVGEAVDRAETEVLTALPTGPAWPELLDDVTARESRALARGVRLRTLFGDGVRDDAAARDRVTVMSAKGTRFRTLLAPFQRCVVVDRRQAFISDHVVGGDPDRTAWHVMDRAFVAFVAEGFEDAWRRADVWHGDPRRAVPAEAGDGLTDRQREILIDTAAGVDQRITARRLNIGLRTLTKELGRLRARWGVSTLAALAYQWALSPERRQTRSEGS